ncbi:C45 family autoproteolytic acyltransferase/hydolase [Desulfoluna spongiiphila]|uniref:C45 family autoproteolytic acyltransferase/hydolase n=1 Tax=Desulfoluna spongiiphila TaxID=419481 RepID=UPI0012559075|nr:C45 family peptidase [Desulfoluna spongiiphila]VVS91587.1 peptidase c45 [Desulfoluna spongiiphila]
MYHPRFKGDHYGMGLRFGGLLKKNGIALFGMTELDEVQRGYGMASENIVRKFFPGACEEMRGLADGLGVSYETFSAWLLCISVCLEVQGCSMIACKREGRVVFGRNNDLPPVFRKMSSSALYAPSGGYAFIANSSAFVGAEDGINEKGLAAGMTYVWGSELKAGINSMFFVRYILERCATVAEGLKALEEIPMGGAYHLILADRGDMAHVECSPQKMRVHRGEVAVATNHFVSEEMAPCEETKDLYQSYARYKTASDAVGDGSRAVTVDNVRGILGGKRGFMCQYEKALAFDTVWSSVYDPANRKVYRAEGNPSRCRYREDVRFEKICAF